MHCSAISVDRFQTMGLFRPRPAQLKPHFGEASLEGPEEEDFVEEHLPGFRFLVASSAALPGSAA
jgi:hypothetical protein